MAAERDEDAVGDTFLFAPPRVEDGDALGGSPPRVVAGRYELRALLGQGGMGAVYRAHDRELDEVVALKFLRAELQGAGHAIDRFVREVKLARRVTHPNVARIYEFGIADQSPFLTMEYVKGESVASILRRTSPLEPRRAIAIATAVCHGLAAAHEVGVIHRDIKPDNVLVAENGRVVITDFGIAYATASEAAARQTESPIGTPAYMAPEQVELGPVTPRTDLFAVGVLLFELVTGALPWAGKSALSMALARLKDPPIDPRSIVPGLPESLAKLILRCLAQDPEHRPESAHAMISELEAIAPALGKVSKPVTRPPAAPAPTSSERRHVLCVLPLRNDGAPEDAGLALGLTEDLADALCRVRGLRVRSPELARPGLSESGDLASLGQKLGVDTLVTGSLRRAGDRFLVSLRLITVANGLQVWAERSECSLGEVLKVQDRMAASIAKALSMGASDQALRHAMDSRVVGLYLDALTAYHAYLPERAVERYRAALALAPDDPMLTIGLALSLTRLSFMPGLIGDVIGEAAATARRALELAPESPEAHHADANVKLHSGDWVGAARGLRAVLSRAPGLPVANALLGGLLLELGRTEEGLRRLELAARLDPRISTVPWELARAHALEGNWSKALEFIEEGFAGDPRRWVPRVRLTSWKRDRVALEGLYRELAKTRDPEIVEQRAAEAILDLHFGRATAEQLLQDLGHMRPGTAGSVRGRVFAEQLTAELASVAGALDHADVAIENAARAGLLDLAWLDRCPLLSPLRERASFTRARAIVVERADLVLDALWG